VLRQAFCNRSGEGRACIHVLALLLAGIAEDDILRLRIDDRHRDLIKRPIVVRAAPIEFRTLLRREPLLSFAWNCAVKSACFGSVVMVMGTFFFCNAEEKYAENPSSGSR